MNQVLEATTATATATATTTGTATAAGPESVPPTPLYAQTAACARPSEPIAPMPFACGNSSGAANIRSAELAMLFRDSEERGKRAQERLEAALMAVVAAERSQAELLRRYTEARVHNERTAAEIARLREEAQRKAARIAELEAEQEQLRGALEAVAASTTERAAALFCTQPQQKQSPPSSSLPPLSIPQRQQQQCGSSVALAASVAALSLFIAVVAVWFASASFNTARYRPS